MVREGSYFVGRVRPGFGVSGHAHVRLVDRDPHGPTVSWGSDRADTWSLHPDGHPDLQVFVDAVMDGARTGVELASRCGADTDPVAVVIVRAVSREIDAEVSATRAAAVMAVAVAFGVADRLTVSYDDSGGGWYGPGPGEDVALGRWWAHVIPGLDDLGPLATSVVRDAGAVRLLEPALRLLQPAVRRTEKNESWLVGDVVVTSDAATGEVSFASVMAPSRRETALLSQFTDIVGARAAVERDLAR